MAAAASSNPKRVATDSGGAVTKPKKSKKAKSVSTTSAPPVVSVPAPVPNVAGGGPATRAKGATLSSGNCRQNVKALFIGRPACPIVGCAFHHQANVKSFTKAEMLSWLNRTCGDDSDFDDLVTAIKSKAR